MLRSLRITNYRGLRELSMTGLGRVNLLVGTNNCGKTSVLEAIHALSTSVSATPLWQAQVRRGEVLERVRLKEGDVAHLVHGHQLTEGASFAFTAATDEGPRSLAASFVARNARLKGVDDSDGSGEGGDDDDDDDDDDDAPAVPGAIAPLWLQLEWRSDRPLGEMQLPITRRGGLPDPAVLAPRRSEVADSRSPVRFITTKGLTQGSVVSMFDRVVLTPDEETVLGAIRTIEPNIERIASISTDARRSSLKTRTGIAMMVAGQRIPIGSMGDGIWRLLGIALSLVRARGGVLLIDEIDTGLHYTVLVDMWRLVLATARSLDVQVFATTHSRDCYEALAAVTEANRTEISLQRIERGKPEAIAFSEAELQQAAERGLEVR